MKISKYAKLGILIVVTLTILIWGLNYLKGIDLLSKSNKYHVIYDRIDGLLESSAVTLNGYKVGQVTDIAFLQDHSGRLLVSFSLEGDLQIPQGSIARIVSSDLMGNKAIHLLFQASNQYYTSGDTLPGSIESDLKEQVSMQVLPLKKRAEELLASLDSALTVVTYVFNENTRKNLSESFEHINQTVLNISQTSGTLNQLMQNNAANISSILTNMDSISTGLKNNGNRFNTIIQNIESISDSLSQINTTPIFAEIEQSLNGLSKIIQKLQQSDNSAGLLLNDDQLYNNLNKLSTSLDLLLKDFRNNPKRYVHFSAFDLGKNVYITAADKEKAQKNTVIYKVLLVSNPSRVPTNNNLFNELEPIEEINIGGIFHYMTGSSTDFNEIHQLLEKARINFPDASIAAFKNGRKIKLEKAIKNQIENK